jgi:hypothetical protein
MSFITLRGANESGEPVGTLLVNSDHLVTVSTGEKTTELGLADGKTRWVLDKPEEIIKMIGRPS